MNVIKRNEVLQKLTEQRYQMKQSLLNHNLGKLGGQEGEMIDRLGLGYLKDVRDNRLSG